MQCRHDLTCMRWRWISIKLQNQYTCMMVSFEYLLLLLLLFCICMLRTCWRIRNDIEQKEWIRRIYEYIIKYMYVFGNQIRRSIWMNEWLQKLQQQYSHTHTHICFHARSWWCHGFSGGWAHTLVWPGNQSDHFFFLSVCVFCIFLLTKIRYWMISMIQNIHSLQGPII